MKKLALILMLLILPSIAQAQQYNNVTTLICGWQGRTWEYFKLNGSVKRGNLEIPEWTVTKITRHTNSIEVRLDHPNGDIFYIDFNNGWPCKVETRRILVQPESDSFNPAD